MMNTTQTTTTHLPYTLTGSTISVVIDGSLKSVERTPKSEQILRDALETGNLDTLRNLLDPVSAVTEALDGTGVQIVRGTILYNGKRINGHLEDRLFGVVNAGLDVTPWKRFVERVYANPSIRAKGEFALFMEQADLPITEDGCFLAYKKVRENYTDVHSGTFNNSVGQVISMPRQEVDDDRDRTCSRGLHFCSKSYLPHFGHGPGYRVMILKIDPADVVSIPSDYSNAKGRTWRYEVVGEVDRDEVDRQEWDLIDTTYQGAFDFESAWADEDDDWWEDEDDEFYDDERDEFAGQDTSQVVSETAFVAPGKERKGWWARLKPRFFDGR
jgi:hypothetical protein